ncbi:fungal-specific transcription factor domain-containing protein [Lyophyllum atratum]|nr:fungal-specific transcription factor domain-containing protein [Lyophyllum atratum]
MPPDPTRAASGRRAQRKITEEELKDIELKRIRGELSCAECRRLKLRCDKKVPCSSCCRRGCESICPCGILSAGQGTRFILADTDQLHKKIADMSHRIRQLEDALAILQSTISDQRHPLLQDELLKVKFGPEAPDGRHPLSSPSEAEQTLAQSIDALGTLTLGDAGEVKYFGRSAGSEAGEDSDDEGVEEASSVAVSPEIETLANLFPFTKRQRSSSKTLALLESHLPPQDRAWSLCDSYLKHAANFFRPIKRDELFDSFMPGVYAAAASATRHSGGDASGKFEPGTRRTASGDVTKNTPHALATLYFLFALGALLDLTLPPYNAEAEHYYELARAALSLRVVFDSPQLDTVQAMGLMATYHCLAGKKYSRDSAWCVMSFAAKLAQGVHRDSARWNMDAKTVQKRRTLFWEVFAADVSHSLALGRPPAMHLSYVDCEFPIDEEATLSDTGEIQGGFWRMKYAFGRDMFLAVADTTLVAKSPSYTTVLELDRKVREISFPTSFKPYVKREDGEEDFYSSSLSLQGFYASQHRTVTMLYLHRSFFAQAMLDHPSNPLLSPFAPSFLTAYRCASVIIKASSHQFDRCAEMAMRVWFLMYHTFSAAIIVGTVVTRSPNSNVAASVRAYAQYTSTNIPAQLSTSPPTLFPFSSDYQVIDDGDDELAIFGGQTRVLSRKSRNRRSVTSIESIDDSSPPPADDSSSSTKLGEARRRSSGAALARIAVSAAEVHPALVEYLGTASFRGDLGLSPPAPFTVSRRSSSTSNDQSSLGGVGLTPPLGVSDNIQQRQSEGRSAPVPEKQMGDMFSRFTGYVANGVMSNPVAGPSDANANTYSYPQAQQPVENRQEWRELSPDTTGLPKADTSFGWLPPLSQRGLSQQRQLPLNDLRPSMTMHYTGGQDSPTQSQYAPPAPYPSVQPYYPAYESSPASAGYESSPMDTDPTGTLLELGLMTGSDIDSGWLSFMQDCGIMDTSTAPAASSPPSTSTVPS